MLPDYPKLKRQFRKRLDRFVKQKVTERAPLVRRIHAYLQVEGEEIRFEDHQGNIRSSRPKEVKAAFSIPTNLPPLDTIQQVFQSLEGVAEDMARQSETMVFEKLDESTRETGNVLDAKGRPFEPEMLLEMLDSIWIDFDENGKPEMPTVVLHPDLFNSIKDRFKELDSDQDFLRKRAQIMARKKEEWRDRESHRKLVG